MLGFQVPETVAVRVQTVLFRMQQLWQTQPRSFHPWACNPACCGCPCKGRGADAAAWEWLTDRLAAENHATLYLLCLKNKNTHLHKWALYITLKKCTSTTQANHWKTKNSISQQIRDPESGIISTSTSMPTWLLFPWGESCQQERNTANNSHLLRIMWALESFSFRRKNPFN